MTKFTFLCVAIVLFQGHMLPQSKGSIRGKIEITQSAVQSSGARNQRRTYGHSEHNGATGTIESNYDQVVVYLEEVSHKKAYPAGKTQSLNQKDAAFIPSVLPIIKGTAVNIRNEDNIYHNVFSLSDIKKFNIGRRPKGENVPVVFDKTGEVRVFCDIHSQMSAYIIVLENPFFAKPDGSGQFFIRDIPAGTYRLRTFHPKLKCEPQTIEISDKELNFNISLK